MNALTLARYLLGNRDAILRIAQTPQAIWLGLLLVLSTGLAREYDGEDLLHEPWHLLLPLGASLVTATILFGLLSLGLNATASYRSEVRAYRSFLALYWMTAPLAWLYAIPVERFLSAVGATQANLWLLAIVALWRVALMVRVVSVVFPLHGWQAFFAVMLFADTVLLVLLYATPMPVFSVMGGIRLTESEQMIQGTTFFVGFLGTVSWPVWAIGTLFAAFGAKTSSEISSDDHKPFHVAPSAWALAVVALAAGMGVLPFTQPEQQRRYAVEQHLRSGQYAEAIALLTSADRGDFPPHWDPPPRIGYGETAPPLIDVLEALPTDSQHWAVGVYRQKFLDSHSSPDAIYETWPVIDEQDFDRYLTVIERHFTTPTELEPWQTVLQYQLDGFARTPAQRERIIKLVGKPDWLKKKEEQSSLQQDEQHDDG